MIYKYNPKVNPKRPLLFLISFVSPVAGAGLYFFAGIPGCIIGIAVGIWIAFSILKMLKRIEKTKVETFTESCTAYTSGGEKLVFEYKDITHAGCAKGGPNDGQIFIYDENADKILQLPPVFVDFESLKQELSENTPWQVYEMEEGESIIDRLKKLVATNSKETESE